MNRGSIPGRAKRIISCAVPRQSQEPILPLFRLVPVPVHRVTKRSLREADHSFPSRLRISGAIFPLSFVFMECTGTAKEKVLRWLQLLQDHIQLMAFALSVPNLCMLPDSELICSWRNDISVDL